MAYPMIGMPHLGINEEKFLLKTLLTQKMNIVEISQMYRIPLVILKKSIFKLGLARLL